MSNIINASPEELFKIFQNAYYDQIKKRMIIGSEEYTLSAILTYALSVYGGLFNKAYRNSLIATAEGEFLDNIASRYSLNRAKEQFMNPFFVCALKQSEIKFHPVGSVSLNIKGHTYTNDLVMLSLTNLQEQYNCFRCTEKHNDYLSKDELQEALDSLNIDGFEYFVCDSGLQQCGELIVSDDAFRDYIKDSKFIYQSGSAMAYEACAKAYADYIIDAHCIRQNEDNYVPGHADLYIKVAKNIESQFKDLNPVIYGSNASPDLKGIVDAVDKLNIRTVGQEFTINYATGIYPSSLYNVVLYVDKTQFGKYGDNLNSMMYIKLGALQNYYNTHRGYTDIGQTFYLSNLMDDFKKPLTAFSNDPNDFMIEAEDFESVKDLTILGYKSDLPTPINVSSTAYVILDNSVNVENIVLV